VQYWTPSWKGLSGRFAYGAPDTNVGSTTNGVSEASGLRPTLFSGSVSYEAGPLLATGAYEQHKDFQSLNTLLGAPASQGKDQAWKAGVQYGDRIVALRQDNRGAFQGDLESRIGKAVRGGTGSSDQISGGIRSNLDRHGERGHPRMLGLKCARPGCA